ncbi:uncharacterized protein TNCV_4362911 [Trichonephila clavipes]|nr:uncharacterized protein TNCV_4362911 [Trichonephila clavipes]
MSQRSQLSDSEAWRVVGGLEGGQTQAEVAKAIGVSQSVISRIWNRFLETGSAGRRPGQGKKIDLYNLASELRVSVTLEDKIIDLREKITSCTFFQNNEQFVKEMLDNIVDERKSLEIEALKKIEREDNFLADQRAFELEKLKL